MKPECESHAKCMRLDRSGFYTTLHVPLHHVKQIAHPHSSRANDIPSGVIIAFGPKTPILQSENA